MCGISGIINSNGVKVEDILIMTSIVSHRGPDSEGYLFLDTQSQLHCMGGIDTSSDIWKSHYAYSPTEKAENLYGKTFNLAFGHRRLSIIDLSSAGHQPMSYINSRYWIVFNGEIYNYREIRNDLQMIGYQFISRTDTEVVLAAYAEWGAGCLDRFVGMWAFAIYDHISKELFLARDRYGIKPLYYWFSPEGGFYFASEIKQLTVCKGWKAKMNPYRIYDYLAFSFTDHTDETMFESVYQLPSGTFYKSAYNKINPDKSGRINHQKWYSLKREPFKGSFNEAKEVFKELFERSIKEHLNADVPVGTALSGGLDSSSIVCEVNRILRNEGKSELQKTFSSCAYDERYDERKWMEIVTDQTKVDAHFIYPSLKEVTELTSDIIWHQDEPYQSQSAFLAYNVFKLANLNGIKVLLNGQGADEYLGGYGQFTASRYATMAKHLRIFPIINEIKNIQKRSEVSISSILKGMLYQMLPSQIRRGITNVASSSDFVKKIINVNELKIKHTHPYDRIPINYRTVHEISEHLTFYSTLPKYLRWEDRNSMAHSVEARVPFLDHRLVEFTYNLADEFLEKDGVTKRIMREALDGLLPEKIKNRKDKMGFITPEENWVKYENPAFFRQKISEAINITEGIIKPEALTYFDNMVNQVIPFDYTYWRIILFSEWIQKFQVKAS